jgi:hypothetical protein
MSLKKRHIGRRVAGIGVGVALMVLGLQAPAFADTAVTAVAPSSGPANCVVAITGTGFRTFPDSSNTLTFTAPTSPAGDVNAATWFSISDTEIWAVVPTLAVGTTYTVKLKQPSGTNTAGGTFLSTGVAGGAAGGCAPTIASFTPTCSSAGVVVTIKGTNLLDASNLLSNNSGADVFFQDTTPPATTLASQPVPDLSEPTSISAIVPSNVADGPIEVRTDVDANAATGGLQGVFSTTSFLTPPPDCVPVTGTEHARAITFKLKKSGKASGVLSSTEDPAFDECVAAAPVKIQKKKKGDGWKTKATATTDDTGSYSATINAKPGKYRALAPKVSLGDPVTDVCLKTKSAARKIG